MRFFPWPGVLSIALGFSGLITACSQDLFLARTSLPSLPGSGKAQKASTTGNGTGALNRTQSPFDVEEDGKTESATSHRGGLRLPPGATLRWRSLGPPNTTDGNGSMVGASVGEVGIFFAGANLKCLDLTGSGLTNGNQIQIWDCNGGNNQKWLFKAGSWSIHSFLNTAKCIDVPGGQFNNGAILQIWDCVTNQGYPIDGQKFGYDSNAETIYATNSKPIKCIDLLGGATTNGNKIGIWDCNNQDKNQKWTFTMPKPGPGPGPGPGPHGGPIGPGNWPTFATQAALQADGAWAKYFTTVYGALPSQGFPIKTGDLWMLYGNILKQSGITVPGNIPSCPTKGTDQMLFSEGAKYQSPGTLWIWHAGPAHYGPAPAKQWTEVIHQKDPFGDEHFGAWFLYAYGSGIYFYTGKTEVYDDHPQAYKKYGVHSNEPMCKAAAAAGVTSLQFINRHDPTNWPCQNHGIKNLNFEIVGVSLKGSFGCCSDGKNGYPQLKSGWWATTKCNCKEGQYLNCGHT